MDQRIGSAWIVSLMLSACGGGGPEPSDPPPVPDQADCPEGFGPIDGYLDDGCYMPMEPADWTSAEDACEGFASLGAYAHLLIVDRPAEHEALSLLSAGTTDLWIGRFQPTPEDSYRNVNYIVGAPDYFAASEPNDYGEDCDILFGCDGYAGIGDERCIEYAADTGMWNDEVCFDVQPSFCEWDSVDPYDWRPHAEAEDAFEEDDEDEDETL